MRHRVKLNHLGRKSAHRKALLSHLACDLISHKRIITTLAKAKALRVYVEPLITKSKTNTTHQRRVVFSYLQDKEAVSELFGDISAKIGQRPGGYTRIIKLGARLGDAAEMALIELVDYNEIYSNESVREGKQKRTRRGGRSRSKSTTTPSETAGESSETTVAESEPTKESPAKEEKTPVEEVTEEAPAPEETAKADKTPIEEVKEETPAPEPESEAEVPEKKDAAPDIAEPKPSEEEDKENKDNKTSEEK